MNSVKLQDIKSIYRNRLRISTLTTNHLKNKSIPFTIASERIKYLGIILTNEVKDPSMRTVKMLIKEIGETQISGKIYLLMDCKS